MTNPDQWKSLVAEIMVMADGGARVDEKKPGIAVFSFEHPFDGSVGREVVFTLVDRQWRAEG